MFDDQALEMGCVELKIAFDQLSSIGPRLLLDALLQDVGRGSTTAEPRIRTFSGSLLLVDISGMTSLSTTLSLADLQAVINSVFKTIIKVVILYSGDVLKFAGDSVYVFFGEDDAKVALACGQRIVETAFTDLSLTVRGYLTVGQDIRLVQVGHRGRWECLLVGETMTALTALCSEAPSVPGTLTIDANTHSLLHPLGTPCSCQRTASSDGLFTYFQLALDPDLDPGRATDDQHASPTRHRELSAKARGLFSALTYAQKVDVLNRLKGYQHETMRAVGSDPRSMEQHMERRSVAVLFCHILGVDPASPDILYTLQLVFETVVESLADHGGQLRQFILDDKGLVAIGTVGLANASTRQDADIGHSAMIIAQRMIIGLENCPGRHSASIGVTKGINFCGNIGHKQRFEYGVMGQLTNLAARLMCRAEEGQILCNEELAIWNFRNRYTHSYATDIKGFEDRDVHIYALDSSRHMTKPSSLACLSSITARPQAIDKVAAYLRRVCWHGDGDEQSSVSSWSDNLDLDFDLDDSCHGGLSMGSAGSCEGSFSGPLRVPSWEDDDEDGEGYTYPDQTASFQLQGPTLMREREAAAGQVLDLSLHELLSGGSRLFIGSGTDDGAAGGGSESDFVTTVEGVFGARIPALLVICSSAHAYEPFSAIKDLLLEVLAVLYREASREGSSVPSPGLSPSVSLSPSVKSPRAHSKNGGKMSIGAFVASQADFDVNVDVGSLVLVEELAWWLSARSRSANATSLYTALVQRCAEKNAAADVIATEISALTRLLLRRAGVCVVEMRAAHHLDRMSAQVLEEVISRQRPGLLLHLQTNAPTQTATHFAAFESSSAGCVCRFVQRRKITRAAAETCFANKLGCAVPLTEKHLDRLSALSNDCRLETIVDFVAANEAQMMQQQEAQNQEEMQQQSFGSVIARKKSLDAAYFASLVRDGTSTTGGTTIASKSSSGGNSGIDSSTGRTLNSPTCPPSALSRAERLAGILDRVLAVRGAYAFQLDLLPVAIRHVLKLCSIADAAEQTFTVAQVLRVSGEGPYPQLRLWARSQGYLHPNETGGEERRRVERAVYDALLKSGYVRRVDGGQVAHRRVSLLLSLWNDDLAEEVSTLGSESGEAAPSVPERGDDDDCSQHELAFASKSAGGEIYSLLLEDQRVAGHNLFARSFVCSPSEAAASAATDMSPPQDLDDWQVWQNAAVHHSLGGNWMPAMSAYFIASIKLFSPAVAAEAFSLLLKALQLFSKEASDRGLLVSGEQEGEGCEAGALGHSCLAASAESSEAEAAEAAAVSERLYDLFAGDSFACHIALSMLAKAGADYAGVMHIHQQSTLAERDKCVRRSIQMYVRTIYLARHAQLSFFQQQPDKFAHRGCVPAHYCAHVPNLPDGLLSASPTVFGTSSVRPLFNSLSVLQNNAFLATFWKDGRVKGEGGGCSYQEFDRGHFLAAAEANLAAKGEGDAEAVTHVCRALWMSSVMAYQSSFRPGQARTSVSAALVHLDRLVALYTGPLRPRVAQLGIDIYGLDRGLHGLLLRAAMRAAAGVPVPTAELREMERAVQEVVHPRGSTQPLCALVLGGAYVLCEGQQAGAARVLTSVPLGSFVARHSGMLVLWSRLTTACLEAGLRWASPAVSCRGAGDPTLPAAPVSISAAEGEEMVAASTALVAEYNSEMRLSDSYPLIIMEIVGLAPAVATAELLLCLALALEHSAEARARVAPGTAAGLAAQAAALADDYLLTHGGVAGLATHGTRLPSVFPCCWLLAECVAVRDRLCAAALPRQLQQGHEQGHEREQEEVQDTELDHQQDCQHEQERKEEQDQEEQEQEVRPDCARGVAVLAEALRFAEAHDLRGLAARTRPLLRRATQAVPCAPRAPAHVSTIATTPTPATVPAPALAPALASDAAPRPRPSFAELSRLDFDVLQVGVADYAAIDAAVLTLMEGLVGSPGCAAVTDPDVLRALVKAVGARYRDVPYHNGHHALCVVQMTAAIYLTLSPGNDDDGALLDARGRFVLLLAALVHDIDHPGNSNSYELASASELAARHGAAGSILERHHLDVYFSLAASDPARLDVLAGWMPGDRGRAEHTLRECVLATDMAAHKELQTQLEQRGQQGQREAQQPGGESVSLEAGNTEAEAAAALFLSKVVLHAADIANPIRPFDVSARIAMGVMEEFRQQVENEAARGFALTPHMVLPTFADQCRGELGFITYVARPYFTALAAFLPGAATRGFDPNCVIDANIGKWREQEKLPGLLL